MNATRGRMRVISALSLAVDGQNREKRQNKWHNMTQISSVLAVATVFISLWTLISRQRRGAYTRDKNTYTGT